ncbi:hypothetical protein [Paracidovorax anthurii]|uniref:D-alanyl-D-alanine carboxypeptidase-like protein n=1 Tax=Paracidovorax anthurii TaxID=78229 RepID=A0A328YQ32_9BURK|nr:hypothetical protein [Paracidovorax anthurii]RAR75939.1 hypothetical protein AX018_105912 [Paracidovorax anthurii]
MAELSGSAWVAQFPTSTQTSALAAGFRTKTESFIAALEAAGASVSISATLRPPERAYLMHYAWKIAREKLDVRHVPAMEGVDIDWVHRTVTQTVDAGASRVAANQMVAGYGIVYAPALTSRHSEGRAIDMAITEYSGKTFDDASGKKTLVKSRAELHALGATFGVHKLVSDPPHWSDDGH